MSNRSRLSLLLSVPGVLEGLPRLLGSGQVILLSVLLGDAMGMLGDVVQLGGSIIFVRSVLMTKGHFVTHFPSCNPAAIVMDQTETALASCCSVLLVLLCIRGRKEKTMLWTIVAVLFILWLLGFSFSIGGSMIHLLLVVALVVLVINLVSGRRAI